jgi:hypothetical protein
MAFSLRNLSVLAYANGFTLWHYKSGTDPLARTSTKGYFAAAADLLAAGDHRRCRESNLPGTFVLKRGTGKIFVEGHGRRPSQRPWP